MKSHFVLILGLVAVAAVVYFMPRRADDPKITNRLHISFVGVNMTINTDAKGIPTGATPNFSRNIQLGGHIDNETEFYFKTVVFELSWKCMKNGKSVAAPANYPREVEMGPLGPKERKYLSQEFAGIDTRFDSVDCEFILKRAQ
jgi:hypothetical protein